MCVVASALGDDDAYVVKGRLIRCTVPGSTPNRLANDPYTGPPRSRQGLTDSFFERGGNCGASEAFTLAAGPRKAAFRGPKR